MGSCAFGRRSLKAELRGKLVRSSGFFRPVLNQKLELGNNLNFADFPDFAERDIPSFRPDSRPPFGLPALPAPLDSRGMSWNVLITAKNIVEVGQPALALLRAAGCRVELAPRWGPLPPAELEPLLTGYDAALVSMDKFTAPVLASKAAAGLKILSRWGVGYDAIDIPAATTQGIVVGYTPGLLDETVADLAFALILSVARNVHLGHAGMVAGQWKQVWGTDVHNKTLGLLGCGRIGQAVARRAAGFNLRQLGYDVAPSPHAENLGVKFVSLDELLAESDFLSLHAALTPDNRGLLSEERLRRMKRSAFLINTARGALVDEAALARLLQEGVIAGAALDAFVVEPLPLDHPLRSAPNVLLTPHFASCARETGERVSTTAAQAIVDLMQGRRPKFVVNPAVFDSPACRAKVPA